MTQLELKQSDVNSVVTLFSSGHVLEALKAVKILSNNFPKDSLLHNITGACHAGLGNLDLALESYEKAIAINPSYAKAHFNLGVAHHELGQLINSIKSYERSIEIDPYYAEAHNNLGNVLKDNDQFDSAIKSFEKALKIKPDYFEVYYSLGVLYQDNGQLDLSIKNLQSAVAIQPNLSQAFNLLGLAFKDLGEFDKSIESHLKALELNPNFSESYNNLGNTYKKIGQLENSIYAYKKAIEINPDFPALHNNLGNAYRDFGQLEKSIKSHQDAIIHNPENPDTFNSLGNSFKELGQFDEAIKNYEKAIAIKSDYSDAYVNIGNVLKDLNQLDDAVKFFEKAIEINPESPEPYNNLGIIFKDINQLDDAVKCFEKALEINPNFVEAYSNFGNLYVSLGSLNDALKCFEKAIEINPNFPFVFNNLGNVHKSLNNLNQAIECYEKAILLDPDFAEAYNNFGNAYKDLNDLNNAQKSFEKAISINPDFAEAHNNLGNIFKDLNELDSALKSYEKARLIRHDLDFVLGNILSTKMNYCNWDNLNSLLDELIINISDSKKVVEPFTLFSLIDDPALQRKATEIRVNNGYLRKHTLPQLEPYFEHKTIRIGYFSGDFKIHPAAYLTAELYELHDRDHFEIHAFSFGKDTNDELNLRIKAGVDHFHNVESMSHQELAELARSLEIDIAVDLTGFTAEARTDTFAMSAAPIQLSYIGYLGTMGADYYDYLIADPIMIPKESQKHYAEKIVYLPSFQVNDSTDLPPDIILTRKDVGLPDQGFVFCCFNNTYKFTPTVFDSWARILKAVEGSVLIVFANNELSKINLTKEINLRGIESNRLIFADSIGRAEYLARYRVADLFLDTHPYNAGTTASDALKMGLPLITMIGESFNSREAASILNSINLPELITNSMEEYEALAIELATNPDQLTKIKDKLHNNLSEAPLFDTPLFTKNLESAYTQMYERHQKGLEPDHIYI